MVSNEPTPQPTPSVTLRGLCIVIEKQEGESRTVLGAVFAPTQERLEEIFRVLDKGLVTVNLASIRGGTVTIEKP